MTAVAYVGLFGQAFSVIAETVDFAGQVAALALVTGALAFAGLSARAASSEAVRAGSPRTSSCSPARSRWPRWSRPAARPTRSPIRWGRCFFCRC